MVYYPVHIKEEYFKLLEEIAGFDSTDDYHDLIIKQKITEKHLPRELESAFHTNDSLDEQINSESSDSWTIKNRLYYDFAIIEENLEYEGLQSNIEIALSELNEREREIIRMRYGFYDNKLYTLEEIGVKYGVTRERIRQIEEKALRKLRHPSKRKYYGR